MIKAISIINYLGEAITMDLRNPNSSGFLIKSIDGLGPGKAEINYTEVASSDGAVYNSARLPSRNIVMDIKFLGNTIEDIRHLSYKYFPIKKPLVLLVQTDRRFLMIEGYVESNEPNVFSKDESCQISIVCPNPYFYSVGEANKTTFYGVEPLFEFPFENDSLTEPLIEFGNVRFLYENNIVYTGDVEIGITIKIHAYGPADNITIYNVNTRESMRIDTDKIAAITGSALTVGDDIIVVTEQGNKSITLIRNGLPINILNCLDKNTDWFTLTKGDNVFTYTVESGGENLDFFIENRIAYEGV